MSPEERRHARANWPVRVFRLGEEPPAAEAYAHLSPEARLRLVQALSQRMAELAGIAYPTWDRGAIPLRVLRPT